MADTTPIPCPDCGKVFNVPEQVLGKKIKCKECGTAFVAEPPKKAVKPTKPGGTAKPKKEPAPEPKKEEPKKPVPSYGDDDEGDGGGQVRALGVVDEGEDVARCPHCAKELDPPDAVVCIHCGFNNVTRTKADSKKVWAPDASDWMNHLAPGVGALLIVIALIVVNVLCIMNMEEWMTGSFLQLEEKGMDGKIKFMVKPGAFMTFVLAATIMPMIKIGRFAFKRLAIEYTPVEQVKK